MIINSTRLRSDYNRISDQCRESGEAVYITKNGEGDTVLMNLQSFETMMDRISLSASILEAERDRLAGGRTYALDDVSSEMRRIIHERE